MKLHSEYDLVVIDECSTVSNTDMQKLLEMVKFKKILLVGDTYQINSIRFGNWFTALRSFLPEASVFELTTPSHYIGILKVTVFVVVLKATTKISNVLRVTYSTEASLYPSNLSFVISATFIGIPGDSKDRKR